MSSAEVATAQCDPEYQAQVCAERQALLLQNEKEQIELRCSRSEWQARDLALHSLFLHSKHIKEEEQRKIKEQQVLLFIIILLSNVYVARFKISIYANNYYGNFSTQSYSSYFYLRI